MFHCISVNLRITVNGSIATNKAILLHYLIATPNGSYMYSMLLYVLNAIVLILLQAHNITVATKGV